MKYDVSIVIPVKSDCLLDCALDSIKDEVEVIVSLNFPSEEVRMICEKWRQRNCIFELKVIETQEIGMPVALNNGVEKAKFSKVIVLDSDCVLESDAIKYYQEHLEIYDFVRGTTKVKEINKFWYQQTKMGVESVNVTMKASPKLYGPSIAFRKEKFLELGGYDKDILYGCDHKFSDKVIENNYTIVFCEKAIVWHTPISFSTDRRSHIGYGKGNRVSDKKALSHDGLKFILSKIYPSTIYNKFINRGFGATMRTSMQFLWMIKGYIIQMVNDKL